MRLISFLTFQWTVGSLCLNSIAYSSFQLEIFEKVDRVPLGWIQEDSPPAYHSISFQLAIRQDERYALFEQHIINISSPDHPSYGQHMEYDELKSFLRPEDDIFSRIKTWLVAEGISETSIEDDGDWVNFVVPVIQAEKMFRTRFYYFRHKATGIRKVRTLEYALPTSLHGIVQMVQPTIHFGLPKPRIKSSARHARRTTQEPIPKFGSATVLNATYCNETMTVDCLRALYDIGDFRADPKSGARLGVSGFAESHVDYNDLTLFIDKWAPYAKGSNFTVVSINGGNNTQNDTKVFGSEASMDIELGLTLSYNTPVIFYTTGGRGPLIPDLQQPDPAYSAQEPWLEHLQFLVRLPQKHLPNVLSISYGEDEQSLPESYTRVVCNLFAQLGGRGVSVITSSGDGGPGDGCMTNDGKNTTRFMPQFPASCPWVTSVGGTYAVQPEQAVILSGGGFSDRFPRPPWQDEAARCYLSYLGDQFKGLYNPTGRGIPDVSAQGWINHPTFVLGSELMNGGTSAAAPTFAAIIANLNSIRLSKGQKPLGFLNPWLYGKGRDGLTDITLGGSRGCYNTTMGDLPSPEVPGAGFKATTGWDAVTGLGTPLFNKLRQLMD